MFNIEDPSNKGMNHRTWVVIAVLFMLGFLAGLGLRIFAGHQSNLFLGPDHMVASPEQVYVHANGHLFVLTGDGNSVRHLGPDELQLIGQVIDLRIMPDGRVLIAEQVPARIRLCDPESWVCSEVMAPLAETLSSQFKVLPDASGAQLYITDSIKNGRLYKLDISTGSIEPILTDVLSYPNDIQRGPEGELWIADSYNRRVVNVRVDTNSAELTRVRFNTQNSVALGDRTWPMMLQSLGGGEWAVTQPPDTGGRADLLIYQDGKTLPRRLPLAAELDPTDIVIANGRLLVSDIFGFAVYTLDTESGQHARWGDPLLNDWFSEQQGHREYYQGLVDIGLLLMLVCVPFMLIAAYLGTNRENRKSLFSSEGTPALIPSDDPPPSLSAIHWLNRNKKMDLLFRWMMPVMVMLIVLMLVVLGFLLPELTENIDAKQITKTWTVIMIFGGLMVGTIPLMYININMVRGQLGTDGQHIFVRYPGGDQDSALPMQIVFTKQVIHFGKHTISIGTRKNQALYEDGEIETYIAPLLKHARKVGIFGLFTQQLDDGEYGQVYTWLYIFGAIAAVIYLEFSDKLNPV